VLTALTLERAAKLQSIASTLGPLQPIPPAVAEELHPIKYQDKFVSEYWRAWLRGLAQL
jgi:hypothetical protein